MSCSRCYVPIHVPSSCCARRYFRSSYRRSNSFVAHKSRADCPCSTAAAARGWARPRGCHRSSPGADRARPDNPPHGVLLGTPPAGEAQLVDCPARAGSRSRAGAGGWAGAGRCPSCSSSGARCKATGMPIGSSGTTHSLLNRTRRGGHHCLPSGKKQAQPGHRGVSNNAPNWAAARGCL